MKRAPANFYRAWQYMAANSLIFGNVYQELIDSHIPDETLSAQEWPLSRAIEHANSRHN